MLQVSSLTAGYFKGRDVLKNISLTAARGSMISVVGANGAGKSTLLSALVGLVPHVKGAITLDGESLTRRRAHETARRGVRLVPENRGTLPSLSVHENLQLGGIGLPKRIVAERIERELERFPPLKKRLQGRAGMLSGGEQQMLAIGRAMVAAPATVARRTLAGAGARNRRGHLQSVGHPARARHDHHPSRAGRRAQP